jgi:hypothetical protein
VSYSAGSNYRDELLKEFVDEDYISDSDAYINDLAISLGVVPTRIPTPCPNIVKRLSIALTYRTIAGDRSMMNNEGDDGRDAYELKRVYWANEVERLEGLITADALTGGKDGLGGGLATKVAFPMSVPIYRS